MGKGFAKPEVGNSLNAASINSGQQAGSGAYCLFIESLGEAEERRERKECVSVQACVCVCVCVDREREGRDRKRREASGLSFDMCALPSLLSPRRPFPPSCHSAILWPVLSGHPV